MRQVLQEEVDEAKQNIETFTNLKGILGDEWLNSHLVVDDRYKKHPIFWILIDKNRCQRLSRNLDILNKKCEKFNRIVNKLKNDKNVFNFHSLISEIEVLAYYYNRVSDNYEVSYEPEIKEKNKKIDCKLVVNDTEYNLEILTVFEDEEGQSIQSIHDEIRKQLDGLQNNPFILSFGTEIDFSKSDIPDFINFVKELLDKPEKINHKDTFEFNKNDKKLGKIMFYKGSNIKGGFVGFMHSPVRVMDCAGRIKNKILSKIDQLPNNSKNVVVVNLAHITQDFIDLEEVFFGQSYVNINIKTHESTPRRHPNSIVNHPKGKDISMIVGYTYEDYNTRKFFVNLSANDPVDKQLVETIF